MQFFGISSFANKIEYVTLLKNENLHIKILSFILPIVLAFTFIFLIIKFLRKKVNIKFYKLLVLFMYSLIPLVLIFPISDVVHFIAGGYVVFILETYLLVELFKIIYKKCKIKQKYQICEFITNFLYMVLILITLYFAVNNYCLYFLDENKAHNIKHCKGIIIGEELLQKINEIDEFIIQNKEQGKTVYILDSEACIYNIPLDIYIKDYDLFNKGNLGKDGTSRKIEEIKTLQKQEKTVFLVRNRNYSLNWQTPMEIINYVRENMEKIGEISIFDIYE